MADHSAHEKDRRMLHALGYAQELRRGMSGFSNFAIWCAAPAGLQRSLVEADPERFFVPPYVGHRGWLGVRLDRALDWDELAGICEDAYAQVAPPSLLDAVIADLEEPEEAVREQPGGR